MKRWLIRLALSGLAFYLTFLILNFLGSVMPGAVELPLSRMKLTGPPINFVAAVFCLCLVNSLVRPVVKILSLPLTMLTFGLSQLVINSALFWAVGYFTHTYSVEGAVAIFLGPILMGFFTTVLSFFVRE